MTRLTGATLLEEDETEFPISSMGVYCRSFLETAIALSKMDNYPQ